MKNLLLIGAVILLCLLVSSQQLSSFMPSSVVMVAMAVFVAAFSLFAVVIWRERPRDEREAQLVLASDRIGFLAGAVMLTIGIVVQTLRHHPTDFLIIALAAMVLAKITSRYLQK